MWPPPTENLPETPSKGICASVAEKDRRGLHENRCGKRLNMGNGITPDSPKRTATQARAGLAQGKRVFVYCPDGHGPGPEFLASSGVADLLDSDGRLDATALVESWNAPPQRGERQGSLFDVP